MIHSKPSSQHDEVEALVAPVTLGIAVYHHLEATRQQFADRVV
jgi:hypothetical protein